MEKRKRGDIRNDGLVFIRYKRGKEYWASKETLNELRNKDLLANNKQSLDKIGHARKIISGRKRYAKQANIPFLVSVDEILQDLPEICPVLGISLSWGIRKGQKGNKDTSPSLDRFNSNLGYIPGNVFWISQLANRIKSNFNFDQINAVAAWMNKIELTKQEC